MDMDRWNGMRNSTKERKEEGTKLWNTLNDLFILKNPQLIFENFQQKWTMFSWNDDNLTVLWFQNLCELMDIHEQVARQFEVDWIYEDIWWKP